MLQTIYREIDFEDELTARQQRDTHLAELEAQGMECIAETLYNIVEGWRVFTLIAIPPTRTDEVAKPSHSAAAPSKRSDRPERQPSRSQRQTPKRTKFTYDVL